MTTLLVANRGEIALRIFRTAQRMGLRTVAVHSDADADALHVKVADVRRRIGPSPAAESYLRGDRIIEAALETGAELVHPGYGFLAEDARFARACEESGLRFVGPPSRVLERVGDKAAAKALAAEAGVPVLPSYAGEDQSDDTLLDAARQIGFPIIVKPSGGGGGKGMNVVRREEQLAAALDSARRIARAAFDDDRLILERYLEGPRHVEVQVVADARGRVIHLGERDCSLQRRHQKVVEESPAPGLDAATRSTLHGAGVTFARHAGYVGAGTCEFLVGTHGEIGFIEMNARLQVEHPVTELVTDLDLVELQLGVAMGEELPLAQEQVHTHGHAVEARVYAEAPEDGFLPQAGRVEHVRWPEGLRVDAGIEEGTVVTPYYDPLLAKLVAYGEDRESALNALRQGLGSTEILGVRTNVTFLSTIVQHPAIAEGSVTTDWLSAEHPHWAPPADQELGRLAIAVAAAAEAGSALARGMGNDPWSALGPWRPGAGGRTLVVLRPREEERVVPVTGTGPFIVDGRWRITRGPRCHEWFVDGETPAAAARRDREWLIWVDNAAHEIPVGVAPRRLAGAGPAHLDSPLPGRVIAVNVQKGQSVAAADELVVVEAMKMEHSIRAPADGTVSAVLCAPGDHVERGQPLVDFEPA